MEDKIVSIFIGVILLAALIPTALSTLFTANTTGWSSSSVAIWTVLPIIIIIAILLLFIGKRKK